MQQEYIDRIYKLFKFNAVWFPGTPIGLGDVVTIDNGSMFIVNNLTKLGVQSHLSDTCIQRQAVESQSFSIAQGASYRIKLAGSPNLGNSHLDINQAGLSIDFESGLSVFLFLGGTVLETYNNIEDIHKELQALYIKGKFSKRSYFVSHILKAEKAMIFISNGEKGAIEFSMGDNPKLDSNIGSLFKANLEMSLVYNQNVGYSLIHDINLAGHHIVPMVKLSGIYDVYFHNNPFLNIFPYSRFSRIDQVTPMDVIENDATLTFGFYKPS